MGKRNKAQFKMMLQERSIAPGGRHVEVLGSYNPHSKNATLRQERIKYWIEKGAHISNTAYNLLIRNGIISGEKRKVKLPKKKVEAVVTNEVSAKGETEGEMKKEEVGASAVVDKAEKAQ